VPEHLAAAAALRVTHRQAALEALARMMDPPTTKDTVAGKIRRLLALADDQARRTPADTVYGGVEGPTHDSGSSQRVLPGDAGPGAQHGAFIDGGAGDRQPRDHRKHE